MRKVYLIVRDFMKEMRKQDISSYASSSAFFIFLSLVPMLMLICTIIPYTPVTQESFTKVVTDVTPNMADELAETVLVKVSENTNEYELQLDPAELGKIKIKLVLENGKIHVAMSCENQKAADLLAATGNRLKAVIEERTGSETFVQVEQENAYQEQEKESQHNSRGQEQQKNQQQETSPEELANFMQQLRLGLLDLN